MQYFVLGLVLVLGMLLDMLREDHGLQATAIARGWIGRQMGWKLAEAQGRLQRSPAPY